MRPAGTRPWLFLDLDGVVSPLLPRDVDDIEEKFRIPAGHTSWPGALYRMHVDERLPAWTVLLGTGWRPRERSSVGRPYRTWMVQRGLGTRARRASVVSSELAPLCSARAR